jgi:hypothetical protein
MLRRAIDFANKLSSEGAPPAQRVVPDPNGGIVFERWEGDVSDRYHLWEDGTIEHVVFEGIRLVHRENC